MEILTDFLMRVFLSVMHILMRTFVQKSGYLPVELGIDREVAVMAEMHKHKMYPVCFCKHHFLCNVIDDMKDAPFHHFKVYRVLGG